MAIKLLSELFDFSVGTIVRDLSFDLEKRFVERGAATYSLAGGVDASVATLQPGLSSIEQTAVLMEALLLTNRNTTDLEPIDPTNYVQSGFYDYNDLTTQTTPISFDETDGYVYITNDGAGEFSTSEFALPGVSELWDVANQQFDFSNLNYGDTVDIRLELIATTTTPNQSVDVDLELGIGAFQYDIVFNNSSYKNAGAQIISRFNGIYLKDSNTRDNPAKFKIRSDDACSLEVLGFYCRVIPRVTKAKI